MDETRAVRLAAALPRVKAVVVDGRPLLRWSHPSGPFSYLIGPDGTGTWGWSMRNTLVDPPGVYSSEGDLEGLPDLPTDDQLIAVITHFIASETHDI